MEKKEILNNINNKFEQINCIIQSIENDLDLLELEYINTYKDYLKTLSDNIYIFSDYILQSIEKDISSL